MAQTFLRGGRFGPLAAWALASLVVPGLLTAAAGAPRPPRPVAIIRSIALPDLPVQEVVGPAVPLAPPRPLHVPGKWRPAPLLGPGLRALEGRVPRTAVAPLIPRRPGAPSTRESDDDVVLAKNLPLGPEATSTSLSSTTEPCVAMNGSTIFATGNWFATLSTDGGRTFRHLDPFTFFPETGTGGFCCDQVVQYIPQIDMFVWLLQYEKDSNAESVDRLAFARTADMLQNRWRFVDITSRSLGLTRQWLDFPDIAVGKNSLYITTNVFDEADQYVTALGLRIPLSSLSQGNITGLRGFGTGNALFNLRPAQNAGTRAYFGIHATRSSVRVYAWDEGVETVSTFDVNIQAWSDGDYSSRTPDGVNWLGKQDSRITGVTVAGTDLWLAWAAGKLPGAGRPEPYVEVVRIDTSTFTLISQPSVFNTQFAYSYPALAANGEGEVGISLAFGGNNTRVSHSVGIVSGVAGLVEDAVGTHGPVRERWGDFYAVRPAFPDGRQFIGTGHTLVGGNDNKSSVPRILLFNRRGASATRFSIRGTVTANGQPLAGVTISTSNAVATTGDNGTYTLGELAVGTYTLTPTRPGFSFDPPRRVLTVGPDHTGADFVGSGQPGAPTALTAAQAGATGVRLTWEDNAGNEDGFFLEFKTDTTQYQRIPNLTIPTNTTRVDINDLRLAVPYTFRIQSFNGQGVSAFSNEAGIRLTGPPPAAPTSLKVAKVARTTATLKWADKSDNETGFEVEFAVSGQPFGPAGTTKKNAKSAIVKSLLRNTLYVFRVRAVNADGNSAYSNEASKKTAK